MVASTRRRVLIIAGGTGGHIFPGLAVARLLLKKGHSVEWLGTFHGLENKLLAKEDIPLHRLSIRGVRGTGFKRWCSLPWQLMKAIFQAMRVIRRFKPDVVLGMGGYAAGPGGIAAWLLRKRLVLHEQNSVLGMTNQVLSNFADCVLTGFPVEYLKQANKCANGCCCSHQNTSAWKKFHYVGNPVRHDLLQLDAPKKRYARHEGSIRLLVFGGSQGASVFNRVVPEALALLSDQEHLEVWHQTGEKHLEETKQKYAALNLTARVDAFIYDMAAAYDWADVVLCRSGALTVAELCAVGMAVFFVPFPQAVDDHQTKNALFLVRKKAGEMISQDQFTKTRLLELLRERYLDRKALLEMAERSYGLRQVHVTEQVVATVLSSPRKLRIQMNIFSGF
ncbi:MAG: undecaprenyldiphospho-muramoylpentapeptide beta-N-acetylglucosaminyltransferase [Pseudomonadota bacterium]|nr:undecaprenyldiphospho-muramoylpentapeptide beta-N-acetylglucosaminyltransferase [Gammaproteobacteria bacterium]MBU1559045.1 undecaprenyldiphospho-muramoylpentapeptide beta-N-acetylglucosaminyltransferase [Gammaproteobacteria bacterium]MBU1628512.1 undecaprenyldiphospho-muramoylpentapeptide beta-N-acetylglucosaminyltransferase [Gammaproteobacteria bacterium]MBU1926867.1 undecaprenyldiphospho-muramoylpentapeptide beta-N-acetylglucosaminyltransferase [Gammaproteobacteria bacterium]MBU2546136.1 